MAKIKNNEVLLGNTSIFSQDSNFYKDNFSESTQLITKSDLLNMVYPIGSIYMSMNPVSPGIFLGGSWVQINGKYLLGVSNTAVQVKDSEDDTLVEVDISKSSILLGKDIHTHSVGAHKLTVDQIPRHYHDIQYPALGGAYHSIKNVYAHDYNGDKRGPFLTWDYGDGSYTVLQDSGRTDLFPGTASESRSSKMLISGVGGNETHDHSLTTSSNIPPSITCYMWRRVDPSNYPFNIGDVLTIDGIECIVVAVDITIQGSNCKNIAVDRNYDLSHYFQYLNEPWPEPPSSIFSGSYYPNVCTVLYLDPWVWGGYNTPMGNTSEELGYGLQNTKNYLAESANNYCLEEAQVLGISKIYIPPRYPSLYRGLADFRSKYGENWFLPSLAELESLTGFVDYLNNISIDSYYWSSTEWNKNTPPEGYYAYGVMVEKSSTSEDSSSSETETAETLLKLKKYKEECVRLFRAF